MNHHSRVKHAPRTALLLAATLTLLPPAAALAQSDLAMLREQSRSSPQARGTLLVRLMDEFDQRPEPALRAETFATAADAFGTLDQRTLDRLSVFVTRHCPDQKARWHWLCLAGE